MKKSVLNFVIAALVMAVLTACGSGGGSGSYKIKMTTESGGGFDFFLNGSGVATVDWGDGTEKVSLTLNEENGVRFNHDYPSASIRTITIYGDDITKLRCVVTSIDISRCTELKRLQVLGLGSNFNVSKNTALTELICNGKFTSLDVSKNTALTYLSCHGLLASLDVSKNTALINLSCVNTQITSLDVSKNTALENIDVNNCPLTAASLNALFETLHSNVAPRKYIEIMNTPGWGDCDVSIAKNKGWRLTEKN